jgi:hypothetical protein
VISSFDRMPVTEKFGHCHLFPSSIFRKCETLKAFHR